MGIRELYRKVGNWHFLGLSVLTSIFLGKNGCCNLISGIHENHIPLRWIRVFQDWGFSKACLKVIKSYLTLICPFKFDNFFVSFVMGLVASANLFINFK